MNVIEVENKLGIQFCKRQPIVIENGQGSLIWDDAGARYFDFTSGWGVTCLGHSHPVITEAIQRQAGKLIQNPNSGFTYSPARARLLELLHGVLPPGMERMFFVNSGAEANDAALKLARKISGKPKVVSTSGAFHGRTFNTLSVSDGNSNRAKFVPTMPGVQFVEFGNIAELESAIDHQTAAVIVEPIQGEGGVRIPPPAYLQQVSRLCHKISALLIIDEIQTSFCRTGKIFALDHGYGEVKPDILTMGKGIAGGFPFAGFAVTNKLGEQLEKGDHGGTYCGNPLGCAVASAVISFLLENNIADRAMTSGKILVQGLTSLVMNYPELLREARGLGLLAALEFNDDAHVQPFTDTCLERGLLVTPTRNSVVRLIPDLLVTHETIATAIRIMDKSLMSMRTQLAAAS